MDDILTGLLLINLGVNLILFLVIRSYQVTIDRAIKSYNDRLNTIATDLYNSGTGLHGHIQRQIVSHAALQSDFNRLLKVLDERGVIKLESPTLN